MYVGGLPPWVPMIWYRGCWYPCHQDSVAGNYLPMPSRVQCDRATVFSPNWVGGRVATMAA